MALNFTNRAGFVAASSGTGSFVVNSTLTGFAEPDDAIPAMVDGGTYNYIAQLSDLSEWAYGTGVWDQSTQTLTRVDENSVNGTTPYSFSSAPNVIIGTILAQNAVSNPMNTNLDVNGFQLVGNLSNKSVVAQAYNAGTGEGTGGQLELYAGAASDTGEAGGPFYAYAGNAADGDGGDMEYGAGSGTTGGDVIFYAGGGSVGPGGDVSFNPGPGATDGGDFLVNLPGAGSGRQGLFIISGLPTSDPGVSGALWINGTVLEVSP